MLLRLTGETNDERSPQRQPRNTVAQARDQVLDMLPGSLSPHAKQHLLVDVLERHVDVTGNLVALGDGPDQLTAPVRRVRVKKPNPEITFELLKLPQKRGKRGPARGINGLRG